MARDATASVTSGDLMKPKSNEEYVQIDAVKWKALFSGGPM